MDTQTHGCAKNEQHRDYTDLSGSQLSSYTIMRVICDLINTHSKRKLSNKPSRISTLYIEGNQIEDQTPRSAVSSYALYNARTLITIETKWTRERQSANLRI